MFDLETSIAAWRKQLQATWHGDNASLDELEDHLREEFAALTRAGQKENDAWHAAVAKLGEPAALGREFSKVARLPLVDRFALATFIAAGAIALALCGILMITNYKRVIAEPTLSIHIFTITVGYLAGVFAAAVAGYSVVRHTFVGRSIPALTRSTLRIVHLASISAAALTIVGFTLGAIWSYGAWGRPFSFDPREIGGIVVAAVAVAAALASRHKSSSARVPLALAVSVGAAVNAAWFGAAAQLNNFQIGLTVVTICGFVITLGLAALALRARYDEHATTTKV